MTMTIVSAGSTAALWDAFSGSFLDEVGGTTGPDGFAASAWFTHRLQRDRLWKDAGDRRLKGWLRPPHAFFSELPRLFELSARPIGLMERQVLLDRLSIDEGQTAGFDQAVQNRLGRGADQLIGEWLPEGVTPEAAETELMAHAARDDFDRIRNQWLVAVYRRYLAELTGRRWCDARAVHSLVADRVGAGELAGAIGQARRLHLYGLTTPRTRRKLIRSLVAAADVEVVLYLLGSPGGEWAEFIGNTRTVGDRSPPTPVVQPVPDEQRELEFVAAEIKKLVREQRVPLDDIAVVARTGRADARFAHEALERAGIPTAARIRTPLVEVPALTAVLQLLRAASSGWRYRPLRHVLESSYFALNADLRLFDHLAGERRIEGLAAWRNELNWLVERIEKPDQDDAELVRFRAERAVKTVAAFKEFSVLAAELDPARSTAEWIQTTVALLDPGWFGFRKRLCRSVGGRHDVVRLDQQGVDAARQQLLGWADAAPHDDQLPPDAWYDRLHRFLSASEIALATPRRTGVQVIEAHEAALVPFRHTFLIHANHGEFPKAATPGWLLSDEERTRLGALGLGSRDLALEREQALWRAVTGGPTTITYRTADATGVPLLPSLMVPRHDEGSEIPRTQFVPPEPFTLHHSERAAVEALRQSSAPGPVAVATPHVTAVRRAILAAVIESARLGHQASGRPAGQLGPWNGALRDPVVVAAIGQRFGPDRVWSASQLETWTQNPFVFLLRRVLYLDEQVEADEETSVLVQGGIAHRLLERFMAQHRGALSGGFASLKDEFDEIARSVFAEYEAEGTWLGVPHLWRVRRVTLHKMIAEYLEWELDKLKGWTPEEFELAFGDPSAPVRIAGPTVRGESAEILLRGRIDRIDVKVGKKETARRIIDYKTRFTPTARFYLDGGALQAPLYLRALEVLGRDVASAEYRSLKDTKSGGALELDSDECVMAVKIALSVPGFVRAGRFEPSAPASSGWKDYWPGGLAMYRAQAVLGGSRFE